MAITIPAHDDPSQGPDSFRFRLLAKDPRGPLFDRFASGFNYEPGRGTIDEDHLERTTEPGLTARPLRGHCGTLVTLPFVCFAVGVDLPDMVHHDIQTTGVTTPATDVPERVRQIDVLPSSVFLKIVIEIVPGIEDRRVELFRVGDLGGTSRE